MWARGEDGGCELDGERVIPTPICCIITRKASTEERAPVWEMLEIWLFGCSMVILATLSVEEEAGKRFRLRETMASE